MKRGRGRLALAALAANCLISLGSPASADIYSYVGPDGVPVFTNDPHAAPPGVAVKLEVRDAEPSAAAAAAGLADRARDVAADAATAAAAGAKGTFARGERALQEAMALEQAAAERRSAVDSGLAGRIASQFLGSGGAGLLGGFGLDAATGGGSPAASGPARGAPAFGPRSAAACAAVLVLGFAILVWTARSVRSASLRGLLRAVTVALMMAAIYELGGRLLLARVSGAARSAGAAEMATLFGR